MSRRIVAVTLCFALAGLAACAGCSRLRMRDGRTSGAGNLHITSGGLDRTYSMHVPASYDGSRAVPLVLAYHGHGGDGLGQERLSGMSATADSNGFIVAYPDGVDRAWNDGRPDQVNSDVDDVGSTTDLISRLEKDYRIDPARVYATGMSNGGMMCYRLALEIPDKIAAVAPVAALLSRDLAGRRSPASPVSVALVEGTSDPLMPYGGGSVGLFLKMRGEVLSAADTVSFWTTADGCTPSPKVTLLPDASTSDGTRVTSNDYGGGRDGTEVLFYSVEGGGHAWPGGTQYLSSRIIGRTSRDFDASQAIYDFFSRHSNSATR
jgi:polyhydroxybutyrate depolymerase